MRKDNLENFILQNRQSFDDKEPADFIWNDIDKAIQQKKYRKIGIWKISKLAATVTLLILVGALAGIMIQDQLQSSQIPSDSALLKEYLETEKYYQHQVNFFWEELNKQEFDNTVEEDMNHLDEVYLELKNELLQTRYGNEEAIINAMIKNYKTKLEILQKVSSRMNDTKILELSNPSNDEAINI